LVAGASDVANGKVYNLGSSEVTNLKDLAGLLVNIETTGKYELIAFPPERKVIDIGDYYSDFNLIKNELGWEPKISLKIGLQKTLDFYNKNFSRYWSD
jgi:dTDP-glucose 4,6-dehydratase/UDP-glucose 4-epimerase